MNADELHGKLHALFNLWLDHLDTLEPTSDAVVLQRSHEVKNQVLKLRTTLYGRQRAGIAFQEEPARMLDHVVSALHASLPRPG